MFFGTKNTMIIFLIISYILLVYFKYPPGATMSNIELSCHIFDRIACRHVEVDTYTANNVNENQKYPSSDDDHF